MPGRNSDSHQILHQSYILIILYFGRFAVRILSSLGFLDVLKPKIKIRYFRHFNRSRLKVFDKTLFHFRKFLRSFKQSKLFREIFHYIFSDIFAALFKNKFALYPTGSEVLVVKLRTYDLKKTQSKFTLTQSLAESFKRFGPKLALTNHTKRSSICQNFSLCN